MNAIVRTYLVEFVGTFAFVLFSAGAVCANAVPAVAGNSGFGTIGVALAAGAAWAGLLAVTVPISGGFLNPSITVMLWAFGLLEHRRAIGYLIGQFLGAALAGLVIRGLLVVNESALLEARLGAPHLNEAALRSGSFRTTLLFGFGIEAIWTFVLTAAVCALHFDRRLKPQTGAGAARLAYLWLGLILFAETLVAYRYTGAAMNPARWFGAVLWELTVPALYEQKPWIDHAPYWIGPTVGAVLAGILYHYLVLPAEPDNLNESRRS